MSEEFLILLSKIFFRGVFGEGELYIKKLYVYIIRLFNT